MDVGWKKGIGEDSGGGRMTGRRTTNRIQGGDDGGRSQGGNSRSQEGDRRDLEQEEPGGTQATAMMAAHGGADGARSHGGGRADDSSERPLHKDGEIPLRTISGQPRSALVIQASLIECAEAVVRVVGKVSDFHEQSRMVFKRKTPLLQNEEEAGRVVHD